VPAYESLADSKNRGRVCARSGHRYNLSLAAALIAHDGEVKTEEWARGVVANMARSPRGGDTEQIKAVAAGECGVALSNACCYVRLKRSSRPEERELAAKTAVGWPNQATWGTYLDIAGAGMVCGSNSVHAKKRSPGNRPCETSHAASVPPNATPPPTSASSASVLATKPGSTVAASWDQTSWRLDPNPWTTPKGRALWQRVHSTIGRLYSAASRTAARDTTVYNRGHANATLWHAATRSPMRILLSNDDGYFAPGLERLAAALAPHAELTVVAPERDRSGASNSLTLDRPLTVRRAPNGFLFVNGTPTDCVHLAVTGLLDQLPDMVISGINLGANMGDDTIYSGTVAAATEGYLLGIPSIAVSLASKTAAHFETAAQIAVDLVARHRARPAGAWLLNLNVPDVRAAELKGLRVTRLGRRHKAEDVVKMRSPRGETVYWVGAAGPAADAGEGTDFHAVEQGYASVTPLQIDLTNRDLMSPVASWLVA
jgi:5'/3'-nucleotidase